MSIEELPDEMAVAGSQQYIRRQLHEQVDRLRSENERLRQRAEQVERERDEAQRISQRRFEDLEAAEHHAIEARKQVETLRAALEKIAGDWLTSESAGASKRRKIARDVLDATKPNAV